MLLFGGDGLYKYDVSAVTWSVVNVQGEKPPEGLESEGSCMMQAGGFIWLYGASSLWVFDPE